VEGDGAGDEDGDAEGVKDRKPEVPLVRAVRAVDLVDGEGVAAARAFAGQVLEAGHLRMTPDPRLSDP
jgi:hypothetical protein